MDRSAAPAGAIALALLLSPFVVGVPPGGNPPPSIPIADDGRFLVNLSAPVLSPGQSGPLGFLLADPLGGPMTEIVLTFTIYGFVPFPDGQAGPPPAGGGATLSGGLSNGSSSELTLASLSPGASTASPGGATVRVEAPGGAPAGTYTIRSSLSFIENGSGYLLESRGFFSASLWRNATLLPNGTPTLNLSRLGVSGLLPETAAVVQAGSIAPTLEILVAAAALLAGAGGYLMLRRGPGSSSGAARPEAPTSAPSALGTSARSDGD